MLAPWETKQPKNPNYGCYRNECVLEFLLPCLKKTVFQFKCIGISCCLFFSAYNRELIIVELEIFVY